MVSDRECHIDYYSSLRSARCSVRTMVKFDPLWRYGIEGARPLVALGSVGLGQGLRTQVPDSSRADLETSPQRFALPGLAMPTENDQAGYLHLRPVGGWSTQRR